jgi:hypothetical protein
MEGAGRLPAGTLAPQLGQTGDRAAPQLKQKSAPTGLGFRQVRQFSRVGPDD